MDIYIYGYIYICIYIWIYTYIYIYMDIYIYIYMDIYNIWIYIYCWSGAEVPPRLVRSFRSVRAMLSARCYAGNGGSPIAGWFFLWKILLKWMMTGGNPIFGKQVTCVLDPE